MKDKPRAAKRELRRDEMKKIKGGIIAVLIALAKPVGGITGTDDPDTLK